MAMNSLNNQYGNAHNSGWTPPKPLPRLQEIMAEGFDFERALKLRQYLHSIDNGDLDWKSEVNAIKAAMNDKFDDAMLQISRGYLKNASK